MSTKKTQGKKLQGGGQLSVLDQLQKYNPTADNKNTTPVTEKLPIVSSNLISNYAPRENDPFSRFSLNKMKDNPEFTSPYMNEKVDTGYVFIQRAKNKLVKIKRFKKLF